VADTKKFNTKQKAAGGAAGLAVAAGLFTALLWSPQEGTELKAYQDSIGIWTICQGDTRNVTPGMVETLEGCNKRTDKIARESLLAARELVPGEITYGQWISFADFIGNAGKENFRKSSMRSLAMQGRMAESCEAFLKWVYAGGRDCRDPKSNCRGLVFRRQTERAYCLGILP
jgi:lysozyme